MGQALERARAAAAEQLQAAVSSLVGPLRSQRDYVAFLLRFRKRFVSVGLGAVVAVVTLVGGWRGEIDWLTALGAVSALAAVVDLRVQYREVTSHALPRRAVHYERYAVPQSMETMVLHREQAENDYAFVAKPDLMTSSGLADGVTTGEWHARAYEMPREFRSIAAGVLFSHYRPQKAPHFNGPIIRQESDVDSSGVVRVAPARYFDLLCTNYLTGRMVRDRHDKCLVVGADWMEREVRGQCRVRDLADSPLANPIGVQSLAFTADQPRRLIVVKQSYRSASSTGLWAPSSSGSLEERDLPPRSGTSFPFVEAVVNAMERELKEESNVEQEHIHETRLLGYFRWLNKGAKPEYVGVTKLSARLADLPLLPRRAERPWVVRVAEAGELDVAALGGEHVLEALDENIRGLMLDDKDTLRDAASFPLYVSLRLLALQWRRDAGFREWLGDLG